MTNGGTFEETFQAVDQLKMLVFHWRLVLTGESLAPQIELPEDWTSIFHQPWLPLAPEPETAT